MPKNDDTPDNVFLLLFNGRATPTEDYEGHSLGEIYIGPVGVSLTYGSMKVHSPDWEDFFILPSGGDCAWMDGVYYSDVEIHTEPTEDNQHLKPTRILDFDNARVIAAIGEHLGLAKYDSLKWSNAK